MKRLFLLSVIILAASLVTVKALTLEGRVVSSYGQPLKDAVVTAPGAVRAVTDENGAFTVEVAGEVRLTIWAEGYFQQQIDLHNRTSVNIVMVAEKTYKYNETKVLPFEIVSNAENEEAINLTKKDFMMGSATIDRAIQGELTGLQVTQKGGMPGEGAFMSYHGLHTLSADAMPLVVINGVPYMPSTDESQLIGGYSKSIFQAYNVQDISNITLLTGAEASLYGSLGANGVLLIETDGATSDDMNTKISYTGSVGVNWNNTRIPLMNASQYKSYLSDIGMTYYDNMETFFQNFPFLSPDASDAYNYLYAFDTDWQNELYRNGLTTDHLIRVEGGDAIAKYDISVGYARDEGILKKTYSDRFHSQINSNVIVSKQVEIGASLGLAYLTGSYQEQGMIEETNPLLAAYRRAPVLSPYKSDMYGNLLDSYSSYYYGNNTNTDFIVSNPLSLVNTASSSKRQYDANLQINLRYKPTANLWFSGIVGLYYNYDQEGLFIPGINNSDIVPQFDTFGESNNIVRQGVNETFNMFYALNANWNRTFGKHNVALKGGGQLITRSYETDMGVGRNTANDFYQTLSDVQKVGRYFSGYGSKWNWVSAYLNAAYTYNNWVRAAVTVSTDGASSTGVNTPRMGVFPAGSLTFMLNNLAAFDGAEWLNRLNVHADYGKTGNSRFSSSYGQYYYQSQLYQGIAGIIRANVPNTEIKWEENLRANVNVDASMFSNRLQLKVGYYNDQASDVLMASDISSLYGTGVHYSNDAALSSYGYEISLKGLPVNGRNFKWTIGGDITRLYNRVKSLGSSTQYVTTLSDGATLLTRVGENPYCFYGYQTDGAYPVYSTIQEASTAYKYVENGQTLYRPMQNRNGVEYQAGDIRFVDQNNDGIINDADKVILGSATPDFYGSLFTRFQYKGFALDFNFIYSVGNEAYNAVRRVTESSSDFSNQSTAVTRRWTMGGQITDMPRAQYNDLVGNNAFSSRWIEDASYLKLRDVTLSYSFDKPVWNFFRGGTLYVTGQNLLSFSHYLGSDPEFSYSYSTVMQGVDYGKVVLPRTVKFGVNLKF